MQEVDTCFACMIATPDIKLQKQCADIDANGVPLPSDQCCGNCFCRPMWCTECMAKWFASKQSEYDKAVWLEQKCSCPMCRTTFCMLDVCPLNRVWCRNNVRNLCCVCLCSSAFNFAIKNLKKEWLKSCWMFKIILLTIERLQLHFGLICLYIHK